MRWLLSAQVKAVFKAPVAVATCCWWPPVLLCTGVEQQLTCGNCLHSEFWPISVVTEVSYFFILYFLVGVVPHQVSLLALFAVIP